MAVRKGHRQKGLTLIELGVGLAILSIGVALAIPRLSDWSSDLRTKEVARRIADAFATARAQAIRLQRNQILLFQANGSVTIIDDVDGDGIADVGENSDARSSEPGVGAGVSHATSAAPGDNDPLGTYSSSGLSFVGLDGNATDRIVFLPNGVPAAFSTAPFLAGNVGSGRGAVYLSNGRRDYAVVLNSLGGLRVERWDAGAGAW